MMSVVVPTWAAAVRGQATATNTAPARVARPPRAPPLGPGEAAPQWRLTPHAGTRSGVDSVVALGARAGQPEAVQVGVRSLRSQQLGVGAALPHAAGLEVEDQVRSSGKPQVVGDEERGLPLRQPLQRFDDGPFVLTVEARRRLVQDQDGCVPRSEEHTSELQSRSDLVCRLLLEKKKKRPKATK